MAQPNLSLVQLPEPNQVGREPLVAASTTGRPLLMRISEVAAELQISQSKCYVMLNAGELPGVVRLRSNIRIHRPTFEAYLADLAKGGAV